MKGIELINIDLDEHISNIISVLKDNADILNLKT